MVAVRFVSAEGEETVIEASEGLSLMENAVAGGIAAIDAICGGNAYCGTCRVHVDPAWQEVVGEATDIEVPILEASDHLVPGLRLSCQIVVGPGLDGLVVRTPVSQS
jgi:2Fe-2S ferredoxin